MVNLRSLAKGDQQGSVGFMMVYAELTDIEDPVLTKLDALLRKALQPSCPSVSQSLERENMVYILSLHPLNCEVYLLDFLFT